MQRDIKGYLERCKTLELDLEVKGKDNKKEISGDGMEFEIRKVRETYTKQVSQLKEEK